MSNLLLFLLIPHGGHGSVPASETLLHHLLEWAHLPLTAVAVGAAVWLLRKRSAGDRARD